MSFNDDEPIANSAPPRPPNMEGRVDLAPISSNKEAPIEMNKQKVLLQLIGTESFDDRPGLDLVVVLDVSTSMKDKIDEMKTAMSFVIMKLSPIDRVSIVTFSSTAARLIPLTQVTEASEPKLLKLVKGLKADGDTNISDGLLKALKVLADRKFRVGRFGGVVLMSDGQQNQGTDAAKVVIGDKVPVFTFGFGANYDGVLLNAVAKNSKGGTFSPINDINNLSLAFSQCLVLALSVVVDSLTLTVTGIEKKGIIQSTIKTVTAGSYVPKQDSAIKAGSFTIDFGVVYGNEERKVIVELLLPAVKEPVGVDILKVKFSYTFGGEPFGQTRIASLRRISTAAPEGVVPEVETEEARLNTVRLITAARTMADGNNLGDARKKIGEAQNALEDVEDSSGLIGKLKKELAQLLDLLQTKDLYEREGRPYALSSETSHGLQRFAARGDIEEMRLFATPRMDKYLEQAKKFDEDPTAPVLSSDEDVKEELAANPLAPFAGPFTFYIQAAIQALQGLEELINNGGKP